MGDTSVVSGDRQHGLAGRLTNVTNESDSGPDSRWGEGVSRQRMGSYIWTVGLVESESGPDSSWGEDRGRKRMGARGRTVGRPPQPDRAVRLAGLEYLVWEGFTMAVGQWVGKDRKDGCLGEGAGFET